MLNTKERKKERKNKERNVNCYWTKQFPKQYIAMYIVWHNKQAIVAWLASIPIVISLSLSLCLFLFALEDNTYVRQVLIEIFRFSVLFMVGLVYENNHKNL